jgi:hypothetical protein
MPHIKTARQALDLQANDAYTMGVYSQRATAHALVAIAVLLSEMQPCPLEPLPIPRSDDDDD